MIRFFEVNLLRAKTKHGIALICYDDYIILIEDLLLAQQQDT